LVTVYQEYTINSNDKGERIFVSILFGLSKGTKEYWSESTQRTALVIWVDARLSDRLTVVIGSCYRVYPSNMNDNRQSINAI